MNFRKAGYGDRKLLLWAQNRIKGQASEIKVLKCDIYCIIMPNI